MLKQVQHDIKGDVENWFNVTQGEDFLELEFGFYEVVEKIYGLGNA